MFNDIIKYISSLNIQITQDFIDYRNEYLSKLYPESREEIKFMMDGDALLLEYILLKSNLVEKPSSWRYDFSIDGIKIDAKRIKSSYFNIQSSLEYSRYIESYNKKYLDYFCFFKESIEYDRPLKVGDNQKLEIISFKTVKEVIKNSRKSNYEGYYYIVE